MPTKSLNPCVIPSPLEPSRNIDPAPTDCPTCPETDIPTQSAPAFFEDLMKGPNTGLGFGDQCDPMQAGQITQDFTKAPNRDTIYRYSKSIRACDEAMMDLFKNIIVIDDQAVAHTVPLIWATQERAVAAVVQTNVRKDNSLVVDRVKLPMLAIYSSDFSFNQQRYTYHKAVNYFRDNGKPGLFINENRHRDTVLGLARGIPIDIGYQLTIWTLYIEDMNQILEQILLKFSPIAYIRVQGVQWETIVKLESIANNIDMEPGDQSLRVIKFQFNMTVETYIPQPIVRKKAVLDERIEFANSTRAEEIVEILGRLEVSAEDEK